MTTPEQILREFSEEYWGNQQDMILEYAKRIRSWASEVIGEDEALITPEIYDKLYPRRSMKDDAQVHYQNKAIAANNGLKSEQRQRAGIGEKG